MSYPHAIAYALEAAKARADYYQQEPNLRYLEEVSEWLHVAIIYLKEELQTASFEKNLIEIDIKEAA